MILITGSIAARPETREQLAALCTAHSRRSRAEDGCISHDAHADLENPLRIVFVERWRDAAAVQAHFALAGSLHFVAEAAKLAAGRPEMQVYEAGEVDARALMAR